MCVVFLIIGQLDNAVRTLNIVRKLAVQFTIKHYLYIQLIHSAVYDKRQNLQHRHQHSDNSSRTYNDLTPRK